jgi:hypothetical protein
VDQSDATWSALFASSNLAKDVGDTECATATISIQYFFTLPLLDRILRSSWSPWIYALAQVALALSFISPIPSLGPVMWILGLASILVHAARLDRTLGSLCLWRFDTLVWISVLAVYLFAVCREGWSDDFWASEFDTTPTRVRSFIVGRTVFTIYSFGLVLALDALAEWSLLAKVIVRVVHT